MKYVISLWGDKGGQGKTTLATSLAAELGARLLDLDPQADASRWAEARGIQCLAPTGKAFLPWFQAALGEGITVVDCPPGQSKESLTAVAHADLLLIPIKSGDSDMVALGRSLEVARKVRTSRPSLHVGVVLNLARETGRAKGIEVALHSQSGQGFEFLGRLGARVGIEEAFHPAKTILQVGGAAAYEFRKIMESVKAMVGEEAMESTESMKPTKTVAIN